MKKFGITMVALALAAGMTACGGGGGETEGEGDGTAGSEQAVSYAGAVTSTDIAGGEETYNSLCSGCHGDGTGSQGPAVAGLAWSPEQMRRQVREGQGNMPAFRDSVLSDEALEGLMAYLVSVNGVAQ